MESKYSNVYLYDPYEQICPDDVCVIYDHKTNFLRYMDDDHLSLEGSQSLATNFTDWFNGVVVVH